MQPFWRITSILLFLTMSIVVAKAGPNKEIRDWYVWCDNTLKCTMQTGNENEIYGFGFVRKPTANSEAELFLSTSLKLRKGSRIMAIFNDDESDRILIETDIARFEEGSWTFPGQNRSNEILSSMMSGKTMTLELDTEEGIKQVSVSLSGVTGSALFIDEAQDRLGRLDALQAKGEKQPQDSETRVTEIKSSGDLPAPVFDYWKNATDGCGDGSDENDDIIERFGAISVALEYNGQLFVLPCGLPGAYNLPQTVLAFDGETKNVRTVALPIMGQRGPTVMDFAYNTDWNDRDSTLSAFYKGRGLGDCGTRTVWFWEGGYYSNFQLVEEFAKDNCDGNYDDWPRVWPPE